MRVLIYLILSFSFNFYGIAQKSKCYNNYDYSFYNNKQSCLIKSNLINPSDYYEIKFACNDEISDSTFYPFSFDYPENTSSSIFIKNKKFNLDEIKFINKEINVGRLSFWDGDPKYCNMKQLIYGKDTLSLFKGTFFCNGVNCTGYALLIYSSNNNDLTCIYYNGFISFDSLKLKSCKNKNILLLPIEKIDKNRFQGKTYYHLSYTSSKH